MQRFMQTISQVKCFEAFGQKIFPGCTASDVIPIIPYMIQAADKLIEDILSNVIKYSVNDIVLLKIKYIPFSLAIPTQDVLSARFGGNYAEWLYNK